MHIAHDFVRRIYENDLVVCVSSGSARAKSKSQMSTTSAAAPPSAAGGSPPPKPKKKKEKKMPPPPDFDTLPDGCKPVFMSSQSQEIFQCVG